MVEAHLCANRQLTHSIPTSYTSHNTHRFLEPVKGGKEVVYLLALDTTRHGIRSQESKYLYDGMQQDNLEFYNIITIYTNDVFKKEFELTHAKIVYHSPMVNDCDEGNWKE
jgi:hypothetical protein